MGQVPGKRITLRGFIIFQGINHRFPSFSTVNGVMLAERDIQFCKDMVAGLKPATRAFLGLPRGANSGRLVVRVGPPQTGASNARPSL